MAISGTILSAETRDTALGYICRRHKTGYRFNKQKWNQSFPFI